MGAAGWEQDLDSQLSALVGNECGAARIEHICFWQAGGCNDVGQTGSGKDQRECQKTLERYSGGEKKSEERIYVFLYFYVVNMRSWMFMVIVKMRLCLLGLLPVLDRFQDFSL